MSYRVMQMSYPWPIVLPSHGSHLSYRFSFVLAKTKCLTEIKAIVLPRFWFVLAKTNCLTEGTEMYYPRAIVLPRCGLILKDYTRLVDNLIKTIGRQSDIHVCSGLTNQLTQVKNKSQKQKPLTIVILLFFFCNLHSST